MRNFFVSGDRSHLIKKNPLQSSKIIVNFFFVPDGVGVTNDLKKLIDESGLEAAHNSDDSPVGVGLSREKRKTDRLTAYACEDSRLNIR